MRKGIVWILAVLSAALTVFPTGCHKHDFVNKIQEEKYLKGEATCEAPLQYYYSCACGEVGTETFSVGKKLLHDYSAQVVAEEYVKTSATCLSGGVYFKSCVYCGKASFATFKDDALGNHSYTQEKPDGKYIKTDATETQSAVYYKSCICGLAGTETFSYGDPLREYAESEKLLYKPMSLTVTLYDTENSVYGFTYNTQYQPLRPVIQLAKGTEFTDYVEYPARLEKASTYTTSDTQYNYYIVKAEIELEEGETYTYRAYDKYVDVGTEIATLRTKDLSAEAFSFAHLSDSQSSSNSGELFGKVLERLAETQDFVVHTGDVVENSKHEKEWENMLDGNFKYLSKLPVMAISGNHETTYKNGSNETYKHFNNKLPAQPDTKLGYYYSFTYGNAKFIMLNTNRLTGVSLTDDQYEWLVSELENNTATWTFVAMHNPVYSAGNYGSDPAKNGISLALRKQLQGIFADYGVDVVLQGHDHIVSRTYPIDKNGEPVEENWEKTDGVRYSVDPAGVLYVMNGPAGNQSRSPNGYMDETLYEYAQSSKACSWAEFEVNGNSLVVTVKYLSGSTVCEYSEAKWGVTKTL